MTTSATEVLPQSAQRLEGPRLWWVLSALVLAVALPYFRSLGFGFVYDDNVQVLANPAIQGWSSLPEYFAKPIAFYTSTKSASYYRPLFFVWL